MSTASQTLPRVTKEILDRCPRLRVLVVGKSGAGKSSLISFAFGVEIDSVSPQQRGICDVNQEITSPNNNRFVLHDSMGYEPGDEAKFAAVKDFVVSRSAETELYKRVHLIWLCIKAPHSGGRALETGDEELLKLAIELKIPVVVVFTQFDTFKMGVAARARKETAEKKAELVDSKFRELCLKPLHKIDHNLCHAKTSGLSKGHVNPDHKALIQLVQKSLDLVGRDGSGDAWIISAMAQRVSAEMKIHACIKIGMKRYWENLALNPYFARSTREECLNTMHQEVTDSWNFDDPEDLLIGPNFTDQIKAMAQLVTPNEGEAKSLFGSLEGAEMLVGVATAVLAPAVFAIGTTAWFAKFAQGIYQSTPETLRCFMAYIVDLILVLHELFLVVAIRPPRPLTDADVDKAFENYKKSGLGRVHRDIRQYVSEANWNKILFERTAAEAKVKELILTYSSGNEA